MRFELRAQARERQNTGRLQVAACCKIRPRGSLAPQRRLTGPFRATAFADLGALHLDRADAAWTHWRFGWRAAHPSAVHESPSQSVWTLGRRGGMLRPALRRSKGGRGLRRQKRSAALHGTHGCSRPSESTRRIRIRRPGRTLDQRENPRSSTSHKCPLGWRFRSRRCPRHRCPSNAVRRSRHLGSPRPWIPRRRWQQCGQESWVSRTCSSPRLRKRPNVALGVTEREGGPQMI